MSSKRKPRRSSDSICPTEEKLSLRQLTDSGLKVVGASPNTLPGTPLFVIRVCKHCEKNFGIKASKLVYSKLGQFCGRSCSTRHWIAQKPKSFFQEQAQSLVSHIATNGPWNTGVPMRESTRELLSVKAKARGDVFSQKRGGNGTGMSFHEQLLSKILKPGWVWNFPVRTKPLGMTGLPSCYKPDFAWPEEKVCIEVDGNTHRTRLGQIRKAKKTEALEALGWTVLRLSNTEVEHLFGISRSRGNTTTSQAALSFTTAPV